MRTPAGLTLLCTSPPPNLLPPTSCLGSAPPLPALHTLLPNSKGNHPYQPLSWVLSTLRLCIRRTEGLHPHPGVLGGRVASHLATVHLGEGFIELIFPSKPSLWGQLLKLTNCFKIQSSESRDSVLWPALHLALYACPHHCGQAYSPEPHWSPSPPHQGRVWADNSATWQRPCSPKASAGLLDPGYPRTFGPAMGRR